MVVPEAVVALVVVQVEVSFISTLQEPLPSMEILLPMERRQSLQTVRMEHVLAAQVVLSGLKRQL